MCRKGKKRGNSIKCVTFVYAILFVPHSFLYTVQCIVYICFFFCMISMKFLCVCNHFAITYIKIPLYNYPFAQHILCPEKKKCYTYTLFYTLFGSFTLFLLILIQSFYALNTGPKTKNSQHINFVKPSRNTEKKDGKKIIRK